VRCFATANTNAVSSSAAAAAAAKEEEGNMLYGVLILAVTFLFAASLSMIFDMMGM
jgi:hypothetical protein